MKMSMQKIAEIAGVSVSTVSRIINNVPGISEDMRKHVLGIMKEYNFFPKTFSTTSEGRPVRTIALVLSNNGDDLFENPYFMKALKGSSHYAQDFDSHIFTRFCRSKSEEETTISEVIGGNWADGVILFSARKDDLSINLLKERNFPFVVIGRPDDPENTLWVDNDNFQAMYQLVNGLIDQGHRLVGFAGGQMDLHVSIDRYEGYRQAMKNRGLTVRSELCFLGQGAEYDSVHSVEAAGYEWMKETLTRQSPDAIVAVDDFLCFGILRALEEKGNTTTAVAGFNNTVRGRYQTPSLTSVDINPEILGASAAKLLIDSLQAGKAASNHTIVDTRIVERDTTLRRTMETQDDKKG